MAKKPKGHTITCESCGEKETILGRWGKQAKRCAVCRILLDQKTLSLGKSGFARKCEACKKEFWPIRSTYKHCFDCSAFWTSTWLELPACSVCDKQQPLAPGTDETCLACVQSSEQYREAYVNKLRKLVNERRHKNFGITPIHV